MQELCTKAVVIKSTDFGEKDKILTLFSPEFGLIIAKIKGVRGDKAKLKFACQPFCFADFCLLKIGDNYQVKTAVLIDNFYGITENYDNYCCALKILNWISKNYLENQICGSIFVLLVKSLNSLNLQKTNPKILTLHFALCILKDVGYQMNFENCSCCNAKFNSKKYLNFESNSIVCIKCFQVGNVEINQGIFNALKIICNSDFDRLDSLKIPEIVLNDAIKLIDLNFENINKKML